ncbi:glycosyltransferase, partial [Patescibacteria group bacterium]|nr:glycosyltransferase [Patescibacteria group bacterium]
MGSQKIKISIIILSWNTRKLLRNCLKSLPSGYEIIVVDNGSTDGS